MSSAPASEDQIVLRSQAIQILVDVVIGNLVRPGSASEVVATGIFIAQLGRLLGKELLADSGYDSWADFFGARTAPMDSPPLLSAPMDTDAVERRENVILL